MWRHYKKKIVSMMERQIKKKKKIKTLMTHVLLLKFQFIYSKRCEMNMPLWACKLVHIIKEYIDYKQRKINWICEKSWHMVIDFVVLFVFALCHTKRNCSFILFFSFAVVLNVCTDQMCKNGYQLLVLLVSSSGVCNLFKCL